MNCPLCGKEMQPGRLKVQKCMPVWYGDDEAVSGIDRTLGGIGRLIPPEKNLVTAMFPASYCRTCRKMVIDTDIMK